MPDITENIFTYDATIEDEIVVTYYTEFKDKGAYTGKLKSIVDAVK